MEVKEGSQKQGISVILEANNGRLQVRGCSFKSNEPGVVLRKGLNHAIVSENNGANGVEIINEIGDCAIIANNEPFHCKR